MNYESHTHGSGESHSGVIPTKRPNQGRGRPLTTENTEQTDPSRTPSWGNGLELVREAARKDGKLEFTALLHHVSIDLLRDSYYGLKKRAAAEKGRAR